MSVKNVQIIGIWVHSNHNKWVPHQPTLIQIALIFFRMGLLGFGGPVALIALMEAEICRKRGWISTAEFGDRFVICKLLPGPVAFQMALWLGSHVRGRLGGLVAGVSFLIPGAALILAFATSYEAFREGGFGLIAGMRIGALVVIWDSAVKLFEPYHKRFSAWLWLCAGAGLMYFFPHAEPIIILLGGAAGVLTRHRFKLFQSPALCLAVFWLHFKAGAFTFGTGLAILPALQHQVVDTLGWLSAAEFLDAVAFGQITPGPVTLTSTFIGFRAAGYWGALAATLGMYLPGCIIVLGLMPVIYPRVRRAPWLREFCEGAIAVVIGCILVASLDLVHSALKGPLELGLAFFLLILNITLKWAGWKIIALAAVVYIVLNGFIS